MISTPSNAPALDRTIPPIIKDAVEFNLTLQPYQKRTLSNGAPLYYVNDGTEEVALVELVFNAGNCYETKNMTASATSHLLKNGTKNKSALEINEHFEYYGAHLNRSCRNEIASVTLHCLSKHLTVLLPVIKEILTESVFPERELDIFKQNSIQQLSVNLKKCDFVADRSIDQYLYGAQHPYGRVSTQADIQALTRKDVLDFYTDFYLNGSCQIFAAGKLPQDFEQILEVSLGDLRLHGQVPPVSYLTAPSTQKKSRVTNDASGVQGAIRIARPFPNRHHPDFKPAMVLNTLFGGFFGSRLMSNIREEKGYTYGIHSILENHLHESAWVISTEAGTDVCEATIAEVYKEMKILREELIDEEELLLVKNYMMGLTLGDLDGPFHVIARWKSLILNGLDDQFFYDYIQTVKTISAAQLQELSAKYLVPEDFFELVVI